MKSSVSGLLYTPLSERSEVYVWEWCVRVEAPLWEHPDNVSENFRVEQECLFSFAVFVRGLIWHKQMVCDIAKGIFKDIISPKASRKALTIFRLVYSIKHCRRGYIKHIIRKKTAQQNVWMLNLRLKLSNNLKLHEYLFSLNKNIYKLSDYLGQRIWNITAVQFLVAF